MQSETPATLIPRTQPTNPLRCRRRPLVVPRPGLQPGEARADELVRGQGPGALRGAPHRSAPPGRQAAVGAVRPGQVPARKRPGARAAARAPRPGRRPGAAAGAVPRSG